MSIGREITDVNKHTTFYKLGSQHLLTGQKNLQADVDISNR